MKAKYFVIIFLAVLICSGVMVVLSKKGETIETKEPEQVITDVVSPLTKEEEIVNLIDKISIIDTSSQTKEEQLLPENSGILETLNNLETIQNLTGERIYAPVKTEVDGIKFTEEAAIFLTAKARKFVPFYVKDEKSETIYIAPKAEQEYIINFYKNKFTNIDTEGIE